MITLYAFFDKNNKILTSSKNKGSMMNLWQNVSDVFKKTYIPKLKIDGLSENWQAWDIDEEIRQAKEDKNEQDGCTVS